MYCHTTECCKLQVPSKTGTSPPRGLGAFGEIIDESPGMQRGKELGALTAPQKLRSLTSVCTSTQQPLRVCVCVRPCVLMHVFIRGGGWLFLSFARHNPFLLSLRAPGSNEGWTWKRLTPVLRRACLLVSLFFPLSWCSSLLPLLHLFLWNSPVLL